MKTNVCDGLIINSRKLNGLRYKLQYADGTIKIINESEIPDIFKNYVVKGVLINQHSRDQIEADKNLLPKDQIKALKKMARESKAIAAIIYYGDLQNYYLIKNKKLNLQHIRPI